MRKPNVLRITTDDQKEIRLLEKKSLKRTTA